MTRPRSQGAVRPYEDPIDTIIVDVLHEDEPREMTLTGIPAPAHLPASPAGEKYRRKYPPKLDPPLILTSE